MNKSTRTILIALVLACAALGAYLYVANDLAKNQKLKPIYYQVPGTITGITGNVYTLLLPDNETSMNFTLLSTTPVSKKSTTTPDAIIGTASFNDIIVGSKIIIYTPKPPQTAQPSDIARIEIII